MLLLLCSGFTTGTSNTQHPVLDVTSTVAWITEPHLANRGLQNQALMTPNWDTNASSSAGYHQYECRWHSLLVPIPSMVLDRAQRHKAQRVFGYRASAAAPAGSSPKEMELQMVKLQPSTGQGLQTGSTTHRPPLQPQD